MRRVSPILSVVALILAFCSDLLAQDAKGPSKKVIEEYCQRAAKVAPLDIDAHFALAKWCSQNGLGKYARRSLERVVALDPSHAAARKALGHVRQGTRWIRGRGKAGGGSPAPGGKTGGDGDTDTGDGAGDGAGDGDVEITIDDADTGDGDLSIELDDDDDDAEMKDDSDTSDSGTEVAVEELDAELAAKKEWIAAVEERMQQEFKTFEDDDFLIHTTLPSLRHAKVVQLRLHLKESKKLILAFLGVRSMKESPWPGKVQLVLLRSEQQFEQFAELVDDVDVARGNDGAYTKESHTVLHNPLSFDLQRHLAEVAVDSLHGREKMYSWWIVDGVAEHIVNMSKMSKGKSAREKQTFYRRFKQTADRINSKDSPAVIFDMLESRELKRREEDRGRAMAMTLVNFFYTQRRKGFSNLLVDLKGPEAPLPPDEEDDDGWKTYWLNYFAFQEKTLKKHFRKDAEALDALWKRHTLTQAKKYQGSEGSGNERQNRGRNARR